MNETYSVFHWSNRELHETQIREKHYVPLEEAMQAFKRLAYGPSGSIGLTQRIIVTDSDDCIVVEWIYGRGITWPLRETLHTPQDTPDDNDISSPR